METPTTSRPYRSHKFPACNRCRQRKVACNVDQPGQKCMLCRERGWDCVASPSAGSAKRTQDDAHDSRPSKRSSRRAQLTSPSNGNGTRAASLGHVQAMPKTGSPPRVFKAGHSNERPYPNVQARVTSPAESSMIVGPVVAEDIQILGPYLTTENTGPQDEPTGRLSTTSKAPGNPILYLSVPRRRDGLKLAKDPGASQKEIMVQILHPFCDELINLFFEHIHPSFPILDEDSFRRSRKDNVDFVPPALLCDILAIALPLWRRSSKLSPHPRPDILYCWNLAVAALQDEFLAPSISTVQCAVIDLIGRPSIGMIGNIVNEGRTMALAHTFGLNRNPTSWRCLDTEKRLRTRAWWGVLINNRWSSLAHGISTTVARSHYDVPLPAMADLVAEGSLPIKMQAAESFLHLCMLSEILGDILPIAYNLRADMSDQDREQRELRRLRVRLDDWESNLPANLQTKTRESHGSNLNFCLLCVKLLLDRIDLKISSNNQHANVVETRRYRLAMLRASAQEIADFVCSLSSLHLAEFWLPYTAHLIASAAMILLRCTVEITDKITLDSCKSSLRSLRLRLRKAREEDEWDLADIFLSQCDGPISKLLDPLLQPPNYDEAGHEQPAEASDNSATAEFDMYSEIFSTIEADFGLPLSIESLGDPHETLWSMFDSADTDTAS